MACEGTTVNAGGKGYCVMKTRRPFENATEDCERMRGRLAIVGDATQNAALLAAIGSPWGYGSGLWLGCSDADKEGVWTCDGTPLGYANWAPGQPDNESALDDCAEWLADSGRWNDTSCDRRLGYICRGDASLRCTGRRVAAASAVLCARGDDLVDWDGAKKACQTAGGKLATVASAEESRALFDSLKLPSGLPSWQPLEGVWIGLTDAVQEGTFRWSDGSALAYKNWAPGQPNDGNAGEDCTTFTLGNGKWNDADCATPLPYVCEPK
jgi:hypothetical protein